MNFSYIVHLAFFLILTTVMGVGAGGLLAEIWRDAALRASLSLPVPVLLNAAVTLFVIGVFAIITKTVFVLAQPMDLAPGLMRWDHRRAARWENAVRAAVMAHHGARTASGAITVVVFREGAYWSLPNLWRGAKYTVLIDGHHDEASTRTVFGPLPRVLHQPRRCAPMLYPATSAHRVLQAVAAHRKAHPPSRWMDTSMI